MKALYKWVDRTLIIFLIIVPLIFFVPFVYFSQKNISFSYFFDNIINPFFTTLYVFNYFFGFLYTLAGIWLLITCFFKKQKPIKTALRVLVTGITMLIIPTIVFYICIIFGMCALSLPNHSLPKIPTDPVYIYHGFPVENLKILNVQAIQPTTPGDTWGCDITVQNTSSSMGAVNIYFGIGYSTFTSKNEDTVLPGQTRIIRISGYDYGVKNPCATKAAIQSAGIVK